MKIPEHPIFLESVDYIRSQIGFTGLNSAQQSVLERIIHSSGDLSMQSYLRFSPNACENAMHALKDGANIITDTYMAKAAISPVAKRTLNSNVKCILEMAPEFINASSKTRSSIGMQQMWLEYTNEECLVAPIVVIGSAPTALMTLLDLIQEGIHRSSLIIGMPVGFIGVAECKNRLLKSDLSHIVLEGSRGGASIAAATINALLRSASD
ncbi:precorrin-8X methylmutase [Prochlorococcus marinus]|uniref:Cobalt-precorrin-8x methylmutase n=1 Tax=Prochlorococcus marinus str. PAC1 TaxID=59924 RepID=A0A0A2C2K7_PROMR|nr:precorrin-8X methylmutase [Prochlorococcus marinus]KGG20533.1 Cobalt-precorrin-8x methylmutase [Prochlorococcus marinus str. PAC1]